MTSKWVGLLALPLLIISCSTDNEDIDIPEESQLTQTEVQSIVESDNLVSSIDSALAELFYQQGASAKSEECYSAIYTETGFTATFNNCVLNGTDNLNGTVTVTYTGSDEETAEFSAVYTDFYVGAIKLNGSRSFVVAIESNEQFSYTTTSDLTIEFEDGTVVSETGTKTSALVFEDGQDTLWNLSGSWTVEEDGDTYIISGEISRQLNCAYWSSGELTVNKNGMAITLDFGDGTCDNKATVTYPNGASQEIVL